MLYHTFRCCACFTLFSRLSTRVRGHRKSVVDCFIFDSLLKQPHAADASGRSIESVCYGASTRGVLLCSHFLTLVLFVTFCWFTFKCPLVLIMMAVACPSIARSLRASANFYLLLTCLPHSALVPIDRSHINSFISIQFNSHIIFIQLFIFFCILVFSKEIYKIRCRIM